ncbi:hypothetical protein FRB93_010799 [Tulasnella sp. JGI-2019a]|nr:hypothetical protein FRB93_010799 [Tulasnella sp. JGI-2019a]
MRYPSGLKTKPRTSQSIRATQQSDSFEKELAERRSGWEPKVKVVPLPAVAIGKDGPSKIPTVTKATQPIRRKACIIRGSNKNYEVRDRLGQGGSDQVFEVRELGAQSVDAMKLACKVVNCTLDMDGKRILPNPNSQRPRDIEAMRVLVRRVELADNELDIWLDLDHPHIVWLRDWFKVGRYKIVFIMSLATAKTLADYPVHELSVAQALVLLVQVMDATIYIHSKRCTHRDLKPSNILLTGAREDLQAMVYDFGISKRGLTHTSKSGTLGWFPLSLRTAIKSMRMGSV